MQRARRVSSSSKYGDGLMKTAQKETDSMATLKKKAGKSGSK